MLSTLLDTLPLQLFQQRRLQRGITLGSNNTAIFEGKHCFIRYRCVGHFGTARPTVVLCPDPPVMIEHYDELAEILVKMGFRVIIAELPGFGYSLPKLRFDFKLESVTQDLAQLLTQLEEGPYTLAFPCVPGYISLDLATHFPDLVESLILLQLPDQANAKTWKAGCDPKGLLQTPVLGQALLRSARNKSVEGWYKAALGDRSKLDHFCSISHKHLGQGACFCLASGFQKMMEPLTEWEPIDKPALVIWGANDRTHKRTDRKASLNLVKEADYLEFEDTGHFPDLEQAERFSNELDRFVRQVRS